MIRLTTAALFLIALCAAAAATLRSTQDMPVATDHHAFLLKGVGEWEGTLTMYSPGAEGMAVPCKETVTAIGDFWTSSTFHCEMMGMPFHGTGVTGYDPDQGKAVGTWVDNMTTRLAVMEGSIDAAKGRLEMHYMGPNPMTGEMVEHRVVTVHAGDSYTSDFYMGDDKEKHMSISMKRAKAKAAK